MADIPGLGRMRLYLWTLTVDHSVQGRPQGECKIQLILPDQRKGQRGSLDLDGPTALLGYSPDYGVFVGWEARHYTDFGYSANVQAREVDLGDAQVWGWSVSPTRHLRLADEDEVRVAFSPGNLVHFLTVSAEADRKGLAGVQREAFMLAKTPNVKGGLKNPDPDEVRKRVVASRAARSPKFSPEVREQFDHACAVCSVQLGIVEAAHIIPVNETGSRDEKWNGLALCPNHHRLYDSRLFVITSGFLFRVDQEAVDFLRDKGRAGGIELLTRFDRRRVRRPGFFTGDSGLSTKMEEALGRRAKQSGLDI